MTKLLTSQSYLQGLFNTQNEIALSTSNTSGFQFYPYLLKQIKPDVNYSEEYFLIDQTMTVSEIQRRFIELQRLSSGLSDVDAKTQKLLNPTKK